MYCMERSVDNCKVWIANEIERNNGGVCRFIVVYLQNWEV
jgi:hypothetical protein